jgi:hypothetical protein
VRASSWMNFFDYSVVVHEFGIKRCHWMSLPYACIETSQTYIPLDLINRVCDGSVLINSTKGDKAEKDTKPNHTLGALDTIDHIKEEFEKKCPGIVSCADILAIAARDAVSLVIINYN